MTKFVYVITDEVGIHGRPAGVLVKKCTEFQSKITIGCKGKSVDAKRIMGVMSLGAKKGDEVEVTIEGTDEEAAKEALQQYFAQNL